MLSLISIKTLTKTLVETVYLSVQFVFSLLADALCWYGYMPYLFISRTLCGPINAKTFCMASTFSQD